MGSSVELTLNCSPCSTTSSSVLTNETFWEGQLEEKRKLEEHLQALEDERRKIEAFKRELPMCMQLLTEAIEASKECLLECQACAPFSGKLWSNCNHDDGSDYKPTNEKPVLEQFLPLKMQQNNPVDGQGTVVNATSKHDNDEKMKWMDALTQASLPEGEEHGKQISSMVEIENNSISNLFLHSKHRNGGAFVPFSRDKQSIFQSFTPVAASLPELTPNCRSQEAHTLPVHEDSGTRNDPASDKSRDKSKQQIQIALKTGTADSTGITNNSNHAGSQSQRKARRCWSPELHRRFVDALQKLGGSLVATPRQIRELMKVDSLTNDEVKSHLQKYRLHTRHPSPIPETTDPPSQPLVVVGGIWVPPEYAGMTTQQGSNLCNSGKQLNFMPPSMAQNFFSQLNTSSNMGFESPKFYDRQQIIAAKYQSLPQELIQFSSQLCNGIHASHKAGQEEIIEDRKSRDFKLERRRTRRDNAWSRKQQCQSVEKK